MASVKPTHVLLFKDDFDRMEDWVLQYPDRETGGQFFGLWTHMKSPYINIVIGPGHKCRHESHSFHQDISYLKNVGEFLNEQFMMCHIGEWHSHHRLRLRQPSSGDLNSIWKHFPEGIEHFLLIIATIESDKVRLWPWIFTASTRTHEQIQVTIIEKDNVFMKDDIVKNIIANGAEHHVVPVRRQVNNQVVVAENKNRWYLSDSGAHFVQHLNSELEKSADNPNVDKTLSHNKLQFSFQRHGCKYVIEFPDGFLNAHVTCRSPNNQRPLEWWVKMEGNNNSKNVAQIMESVRSCAMIDPQGRSTVV